VPLSRDIALLLTKPDFRTDTCVSTPPGNGAQNRRLERKGHNRARLSIAQPRGPSCDNGRVSLTSFQTVAASGRDFSMSSSPATKMSSSTAGKSRVHRKNHRGRFNKRHPAPDRCGRATRPDSVISVVLFRNTEPGRMAGVSFQKILLQSILQNTRIRGAAKSISF